ncbi:AAA family ATPase [Vibrio astriarenae]
MAPATSAALTLIRGLPGSGKSTLAKQLAADYRAEHFEADMYFVNEQGDYVFDPLQLSQAHDWCQTATLQALNGGLNVVVSNTFVQLWEIEPYLKMAKSLDKRVEIIEVNGEYESVHDVPAKTIAVMRRKWRAIPKQWQKSIQVTSYAND